MRTSDDRQQGQARARRTEERPELIGGHVALDLVNTAAWRLTPERATDRLPDARALVQWARAAGVVTSRKAARLRADLAADPQGAEEVVARARELRESLYRLLQPIATGRHPRRTDREAVRCEITSAIGVAEMSSVVPLRWEVPVRGARDLPGALALEAWRLLQFEDLTRLRQCQDGGCGWLFMDRTKNASRVWCSSADCGNRKRARRHYERVREGRAPGPAPPGDDRARVDR